MVKNISFDDYLSQQLKNLEFTSGFNAESTKLEIVVVMLC